MPPMCSEPVSLGLNGSDTSYWRISPVPQHETYKKRSSSDRSMSDTSGGTALNPLSSGGRSVSSAGSAGISITLVTFHVSLSRCQTQIELDRSFKEMTTLVKPYVLVGSCDGRSSSTAWYSAPRSIV